MLGEQAHHEARRAIPTLRSAQLRQRPLDLGQLSALRKRFYRVDLLPSHHGQKHEAAIHRHEAASPSRRSVSHQQDGARTAFSFCAAFFGTGQPFLPQPGQKCGLGMSFRHSATLAVEDELHIGPPVVLLVEIAAQ